LTKKFDVAAWARSQTTKANGCLTCQMPEVAQALSVLLDMIQSGEVNISLTRIHDMLVREFDYPYQITALRTHVRRCVRKQKES
jgi:TPP-dependent trihydroxycyclohexane-1,2-dione (THcHDO) dehydratase